MHFFKMKNIECRNLQLINLSLYLLPSLNDKLGINPITILCRLDDLDLHLAVVKILRDRNRFKAFSTETQC